MYVFVIREKVGLLESLESQMRVERRGRVESDAQLREMEARQSEVQLKSQQIISALKTQVAEQTQTRVSCSQVRPSCMQVRTCCT